MCIIAPGRSAKYYSRKNTKLTIVVVALIFSYTKESISGFQIIGAIFRVLIILPYHYRRQYEIIVASFSEESDTCFCILSSVFPMSDVSGRWLLMMERSKYKERFHAWKPFVLHPSCWGFCDIHMPLLKEALFTVTKWNIHNLKSYFDRKLNFV